MWNQIFILSLHQWYSWDVGHDDKSNLRVILRYYYEQQHCFYIAFRPALLKFSHNSSDCEQI